MKQNDPGKVMVLDFFTAGIWALCAIFNIWGGDYGLGAVSMILFTIFMSMGMVNRQRAKR